MSNIINYDSLGVSMMGNIISVIDNVSKISSGHLIFITSIMAMSVIGLALYVVLKAIQKG